MSERTVGLLAQGLDSPPGFVGIYQNMSGEMQPVCRKAVVQDVEGQFDRKLHFQ